MASTIKSRDTARWLITLVLATAGVAAQGSNTADAKSATAPTPTWEQASGHTARAAGFWEADQVASFVAFNGTRITLHPFAGQRARVRLMSDRQSMMIDGKLRRLALLYVDRGRVEVDTSAADANALVFSNRRGIAVSHGGRLEVVVEGEYASFANVSGRVMTSTGRRYTPLDPNRVRNFNSAIPEGADTSLLPAPRLSAERRLYAATRSAVKLGGLSWTQPEKAKGFELSVTGGDLRYAVETAEAELTSAPLALPPGTYQTRVSAIDALGHRGIPSASLSIRVVGVDLPPGAYVDSDGAIRLGERQTMHFTAATGLSVTRGARRPYTSAETAIGLLGGATTYVHLRLPQTNELVTAKLAPRGIVAQVKLSPRLAAWPRDDVNVRVTLKNNDGGPVPGFIQPRFSATLGIDPLRLDWRAEGQAYVAKIPKPDGRGPWVVRVQVDDQYGIELGRDVLEIIQSPQRAKAK